jgi:hypothetical protein
VSLHIESLKERALGLWHEPPPEYPRIGSGYSVGQQIQREEQVDCLMQTTEGSVSELRTLPGQRRRDLSAARSRIQKSIVQLLHSFECVIDDEMERSFSEVTDEFIRRAHEFDRELTEEAMYQAARNVLIMNTLQMHLGRKVKLTPSVFAYSMLYPYTDNYLDSIGIGRRAKQDTGTRIRLRLAGISMTPRSHYERMIDRLVRMIEGEFDRRKYPSVFESLLAIHDAQSRSLKQQSRNRQLSDIELLDISFEKGGTSVLADGCLVAGKPAREEIGFFFQFGVLLQLIDDLQDVEEDLSHNQWTLVGATAQAGYLDDCTNRLIRFVPTVLEVAPLEQGQLRQLIERSCRLLILEAAACNPFRYSSGYLSVLEHQSPVRFDYLRSVKRRLREKSSAHPARTGILLGRAG